MLWPTGRASGHEIKAHKSNLVWLGPCKSSRKQLNVAGVKPIKGKETFKYLGFLLGHKVDIDQQWDAVIDRINLAATAWRTRCCTVVGRTEVLNAVLASKIWYYAAALPPRPKHIKKLMKAINMYFRQGKRSMLVSEKLRTTPRVKGGLGQIDIVKQLRALHINLVVRALARPDHPWVTYWESCTQAIQQHCRTGRTDLTVLDYKWDSLRATKKNGLNITG